MQAPHHDADFETILAWLWANKGYHSISALPEEVGHYRVHSIEGRVVTAVCRVRVTYRAGKTSV